MKNGNVIIAKGLGDGSVSAADLALINQYTRKELTAEDVYVFPVVMCDNEVDRDFDKFTVAALNGLAEKFLGKTVIFSHDRRAENQTGRIFSTEVTAAAGKVTFDGEPLYQLIGKVYILKAEWTQWIIDSIDGGILKEVSVNCRIKKSLCSLCGEEYYSGRCEHYKGHQYEGKTCFTYLDGAEDAYELSFVSVPAQPGAGIIKSKWYEGDDTLKKGAKNCMNYEELKKALSGMGVDLDGIATEKGKVPELNVILDAMKSKLDEVKAAGEADKYLTAEAVKSAMGKDMTADEVITALKEGAVHEVKSKAYDAIKAKSIDNAIAAGIKAQGDSFDEKRYRKLFESIEVGEVDDWTADFEKQAAAALNAGRISEDKGVNSLALGNLDDYKI